jgi:hypothetical protein
VRKLVLEELFASEVLEVWVIDPAFAYAFIGRPWRTRHPVCYGDKIAIFRWAIVKRRWLGAG